MQFKPRHLESAVLSALVCLSGPVLAQDSVTINPVTVKGILPDRLEAVPGSFSLVSEQELREGNPLSLREALAHTPGVHVVGEDSLGLGLNIGIRGMDPRRTSRTLLLEDGMPLFLAPYGDPSAHYATPLERIQRIEVVKGSGQVLYGPQTVGGMINFVTQPIPTQGLAGSVSVAAGNKAYLSTHANVGYGTERGGVMLDVLQKKGDGVRDKHDFDVQDYSLKGRLKIDARHTLTAKASHYTENSHISETGLGTLEYAENKYQAPTGKQDLFEQKRTALHLQHLFEVSDTARLSTQIYHVKTDRASFRQINDPGGFDDASNNATGYSLIDRCDTPATPANAAACGGRWRPREYTYWGIEPRLDLQHSLFGLPSDAVFGLRYHVEDISRNQYRSADPLAQNQAWAVRFGTHREDIQIETEALSAYAQNTFHLGNWSLTPGLRIERYAIKTDIRRADGEIQNNPESNQNNRQTVVLPGFGIAWNGMPRTTLFAGVHKGFAPPRPDRDVNEGNGANTAVAHKTRAEESTNWELGLRSSYFLGTRVEATLFHTDFDDIVINNGAGAFINGGRSRMSGVELSGRVDFGQIFRSPHNVYVLASLTHLFDAKFTRDGIDPDDGIMKGGRLPYAPRNLASLAVGYQHPVGLEGRIGVDHVSRQQPDTFARVLPPVDAQLSGLSGEIPSYSLLNASLRYTPPGSKTSFFVSGHNLTNKEYLVSRVDGMVAGRQRQVFAGVRFAF
ncbi:TonB-dependent receptor [Zoogloea sp.]|uniref:TonB-dependent receptor family protein n=1 Tax=Zoogloea sp. TaxID=49181 RepID=UPI00261E3C53|nr:TonB-dependent receptor [Zoogloea sp.]MDD3352605.1 TonB-dependent receptor [Zoogloea sp.]